MRLIVACHATVTRFLIAGLLLLVAGPGGLAGARTDLGPWIIFSSTRSGDGDIYEISVTTGATRQVTSGPDGESEPAYSRDGATIAFRRGFDIWTMAPDGSNQQNLTPDTPSREEEPFWFADGQVGFGSDITRPDALYRLDGEQWTPLRINGREGGISSDGQHICFWRRQEVFVAPVDSTRRDRNVSRWEGSDHGCTWHPTNPNLLLFHSHREWDGDRTGRVWLADRRAGVIPPPMTEGSDNTEGDNHPAMHASGWLAFSRHINCDPEIPCGRQYDKMEIFARSPLGQVIRLTDNNVEDSQPRFRP